MNVKNHRQWKRFLLIVVAVLSLAYLSTCLFIFWRQRYLIYRPSSKLSMQPDATAFNLPYKDVWIAIASSQARIHGWWLPPLSQPYHFDLSER
ncbi:MAG: hypothetical protein ACRC1Z_07515 [Waterburya sp.]